MGRVFYRLLVLNRSPTTAHLPILIVIRVGRHAFQTIQKGWRKNNFLEYKFFLKRKNLKGLFRTEAQNHMHFFMVSIQIA